MTWRFSDLLTDRDSRTPGFVPVCRMRTRSTDGSIPHRLLTGLNRLPDAAGVPPYHWCLGLTRKCLLEFGHVRKRAIHAVSVRCVWIGRRLQPFRFRTNVDAPHLRPAQK